MKKINKNDFHHVFEIMKLSFPIDEYRTFDEQLELLENKYYSIYGYYENNILKGFAAIWEFNDFIFIEHLAIHPNYRNQGIGTIILNELNSSKMLCLEVKLPVDELTNRRIAFYQRNQFYLNHYDYIQPSISKGRKPVPLLIMTTKSNINETTFNHIKNILYKKVYKKISVVD